VYSSSVAKRFKGSFSGVKWWGAMALKTRLKLAKIRH